MTFDLIAARVNSRHACLQAFSKALIFVTTYVVSFFCAEDIPVERMSDFIG